MTSPICLGTPPLCDGAVPRETCAREAVSAADRSRREFDALVRTYRADLLRFAFWLTRDPAVAEDAVQEALLRGWKWWPQLRDKSAAKQWLLTTVRRECARAYERKRFTTRDVHDLTAAEEYLIAVEDDTALRDVQRAILHLRADYREPLVLQVLMGYSTAEIAELLEIKQGAVLTRLCRARQMLARHVQSGSSEA